LGRSTGRIDMHAAGRHNLGGTPEAGNLVIRITERSVTFRVIGVSRSPEHSEGEARQSGEVVARAQPVAISKNSINSMNSMNSTDSPYLYCISNYLQSP